MVAAVFGVLGGTCTGYVVQAGRAPTALPSLSQHVMKQARGPAPQALTAAQDRKIRADGDLRKLLVKRPRGAKELDDGWVSIRAASESYNSPAGAFNNFLDTDFRRRAEVSWGQDHSVVVVTLTQYRDEKTVASQDDIEDAHYWAEKNSRTSGDPIDGSPDGLLYVYRDPDRTAGYLPLYRATALARRGDIVMELWFNDTEPINKKKAMKLAEQQWERL